MTTIIGIDYSLTCPCICVSNSKNFSDNYFYFLNDKKKYQGQILENILGDPHDEYLTDQHRYENNASWVMNIITQLPKENLHILIEDYAFGAKGKVFNLAENCGLLKYLLYKGDYGFHTVAPSVIKKYATGKGNANKELMYAAFCDLMDIDLMEEYDMSRLDSPITDIVDSYYLAAWMRDSLSTEEMEKTNRGTNKGTGKRTNNKL